MRTCFFLDADELEWYIPAGIELPDLQRSLTVIEQFEKSPLDLDGKRASELLHKKRRRRRQRRRRRNPSNSDSESSDPDAPRKAARKVRERETYKSAQFIEDSEEEYGRDIDAFFAREAELRKRTALTAASAAAAAASVSAGDGHEPQFGTMRARGTKKRRRAPPPRGASASRGRATKRRAVLSSSGTPGKDGEGGQVGISAVALRCSPSPAAASFDDDGGDGVDDNSDDVGDDDGDSGGDRSGSAGGEGVGGDDDDARRRSSIVDRDAARHRHSDSLEAPGSRRPRARPVYRRRGAALAPDATRFTPGRSTDGDDDDSDDSDDDATGPAPPSVPFSRVANADADDDTRGAAEDGGGVGLRKGRLIISDEEE